MINQCQRACNRRFQAKRRAYWKASGRCVECGRTRKYPTLRCGTCLVGNVIRVDRAQYKARMAKAELR